MIDREVHLTIGKEATQIIEISDTATTDREFIQTTDQIIKDLTTTTIKIDHQITRKIEIRATTIDKETIPNHLMGIIPVIPILKTNIEAIHLNNKDR